MSNLVKVSNVDFNDEDGLSYEMFEMGAETDKECETCLTEVNQLIPVITPKYGAQGVCAECAKSYKRFDWDTLYALTITDGTVMVDIEDMMAISDNGDETDISA